MTRPEARAPLGRIVVVGAGQVALLAGAALARAVPATRVMVVRTPPRDDALADAAHTTLPTLARLHARIGLDERGMLLRAAATHRLATRHDGWGAPGGWMLGYGAAAAPGGFATRWSGAAAGAPPAPAAVRAPAAMFAAAGRFALPCDDAGSVLSDLDYALRFDPAAHVRRLASLAQHLGVEIVEGGIAAADSDGSGGIAALRLADGRHIGADLFVDTAIDPLWRAGSAGVTLDWTAHFPVDRLTRPLVQAAPAVSPLDRVAWGDAGIVLRSPGRDATHITLLHHGDTHDEALAAAPAGEPGQTVRIPSRRVRDAWTGNVVAIGDAATVLPPLGDANLHLVAQQIELLLELLPGRDIEPLERTAFNRRAAALADNVRDFVAAHFAGPDGAPGPWRDRLAGLTRSDPLVHRLAEFARRGRLPFFEEDSIARDLWQQLLTGIGIVAAPPPRLMGRDPVAADAAEARWRARVDAAVAAAPSYRDWLSRTLEQAR